jgi:hypothetical protein
MSKRTLRRSSRTLIKTTKQGTFWPINQKKQDGENVELYSRAYKLALHQISPMQRREQPDKSLRIHASIRRQLKAGADDPRDIAFAAINDALAPH